MAEKTEKKVNGFDLSGFDLVDESVGSFMELVNPANGEVIYDNDNPVGIYLNGRDSDAYRKAQREVTNRRLSKRGGGSITAERIEAEATEVLVKCTVSWQHIVVDGKELECTPSNVKKIYDRFPWIKEQVDTFIADRANFLVS